MSNQSSKSKDSIKESETTENSSDEKSEKDEPEADEEISASDSDSPESDEDITDDSECSGEDELSKLKCELAKEHELHLRAVAELENNRRRFIKEKEETAFRIRSQILRDLISVIDSLDIALKATGPNSSVEEIIKGIKMVQKQFVETTAQYGLKQINSKDEMFDPKFHEAVAQISAPDGVEPGCVVEEMRKGYLMGDRLVRASMVVVAKEAEPEPEKESDEDTKNEDEQKVQDEKDVSDGEKERDDEKDTVDENDDSDKMKESTGQPETDGEEDE